MINFDEGTYEQIPRCEKEKDDALGKMASSAKMDLDNRSIEHGSVLVINQNPFFDGANQTLSRK